jgi:hypothetical protein
MKEKLYTFCTARVGSMLRCLNSNILDNKRNSGAAGGVVEYFL